MKRFICNDCQHRNLVNVMDRLRCPTCGSGNLTEARPNRRHRTSRSEDWDNFISGFFQHPRPNMRPRDFFFDGISHFGNTFGRRERNLFNMFFDDFDTFGFDNVRNFFEEPDPVFTFMDIGDILSHMAQQNPQRATPASKSAIGKLQQVAVDDQLKQEQGTCSVCQEEFNLRETVKQLPCKHIFHDNCILPWLKVKDTCPLCRKTIS